MSPPLLEVRGLRKTFRPRGGLVAREGRPRVAVADVSLEVARGETVGLVGESGCGKTTTALCVLRLVEPTAGEIVFDGEDVTALRGEALRAFRRRAQPVFQDPMASLTPRMCVGAALEEALRVHGLWGGPRGDGPERGAGRGAGGDRVASLLERVGLHPDVGARRPHELSGGQRQRVAIARALAVEPELLVLDEPVSALDVSVRAQVVNLLAELRDDLGLTCLFVAHDLALVEHLCDRVAVMYLGRVVETGPTAELFRSPRHPYTGALLSAVPRLPGDDGIPTPPRVVLRGDPPSPEAPPQGCPFHPRCPHPLKDEECARVLPPLEAKAEDHRAACIKEPGSG